MKDPAGRPGSDKTRFDLLVQAMTGYAVCMIDLEGRIRSFNDGAERMTGYAAAAALGQPFAIMFTPEDRAAGKPEHLLAAARKEGRASDESWRVRRDGSRFWAAVTVDAIRDESGR